MRVFVETSINESSEFDYVKNEGYHIVFVSGQGYQWSRYSNGSKTWQSMITKEDITDKVTHILIQCNDN